MDCGKVYFKEVEGESNECWDDVRAFISQTYDVDDIMKNLKQHFNITRK
jgi:sensor domain CHASE-containing protein